MGNVRNSGDPVRNSGDNVRDSGDPVRNRGPKCEVFGVTGQRRKSYPQVGRAIV